MLDAGQSDSARRGAALATLCETYWIPLYAFLRGSGRSISDAEDLTQAFFAHLLDRKNLAVADPQRGRFRSFLLTCLKHFVNNEHRAQVALKRGGGARHLPLDFSSAESRYQREPSHNLTAERQYEKRWALTVLDRASQKLRDEMMQKGNGKQFEVLGPLLTQSQERGGYAEAASKLEMTEGAFRTALSRLRQRFRHLLREEVAQTVESQEQIDDEIRDLMSALAE